MFDRFTKFTRFVRFVRFATFIRFARFARFAKFAKFAKFAILPGLAAGTVGSNIALMFSLPSAVLIFQVKHIQSAQWLSVRNISTAASRSDD